MMPRPPLEPGRRAGQEGALLRPDVQIGDVGEVTRVVPDDVLRLGMLGATVSGASAPSCLPPLRPRSTPSSERRRSSSLNSFVSSSPRRTFVSRSKADTARSKPAAVMSLRPASPIPSEGSRCPRPLGLTETRRRRVRDPPPSIRRFSVGVRPHGVPIKTTSGPAGPGRCSRPRVPVGLVPSPKPACSSAIMTRPGPVHVTAFPAHAA
jgi:hypothetical protein